MGGWSMRTMENGNSSLFAKKLINNDAILRGNI